jgi:hypothetical protein
MKLGISSQDLQDFILISLDLKKNMNGTSSKVQVRQIKNWGLDITHNIYTLVTLMASAEIVLF